MDAYNASELNSDGYAGAYTEVKGSDNMPTDMLTGKCTDAAGNGADFTL